MKPTLAATTPSSGRGFLITSGILGLIAPVVFIAVLVIAVAVVLNGADKINTAPVAPVGTSDSALPFTVTPP